jgi:hypothetical protein
MTALAEAARDLSVASSGVTGLEGLPVITSSGEPWLNRIPGETAWLGTVTLATPQGRATLRIGVHGGDKDDGVFWLEGPAHAWPVDLGAVAHEFLPQHGYDWRVLVHSWADAWAVLADIAG